MMTPEDLRKRAALYAAGGSVEIGNMSILLDSPAPEWTPWDEGRHQRQRRQQPKGYSSRRLKSGCVLVTLGETAR